MALDKLKDTRHVVIFTTAPAGLGHLRVADALREGFPQDVASFILGASDPTLTYLHRLSSLNPFFRYLQYLVQYHPAIEQIFTNFYRSYLRNNPEETETQLLTLLNTRQPPPTTVVIVATHFGLAHEIAALKPVIAAKMKLKIQLYVVVTDDTFHKIWAVDGADTIVVPSQKTKQLLSAYFTQKGFKKPEILVNPYPISPKLIKPSPQILEQRRQQLDPQQKVPTHVIIPVSGAAVQLTNLEIIIKGLTQTSSKSFHPIVVSKQAPFTKSFLQHLKTSKNTTLFIGMTDRETVDLYEEVFAQKPLPALEIVKPSEQAFKALFTPNEVGGVILLFTEPVGRQEVDNQEFLRRHGLIPTQNESVLLEKNLLDPSPAIDEELLAKAKKWRGLILPKNPQAAVVYMQRCRALGLFSQMLRFTQPEDSELRSDGVARFWQIVNQRLPSLPNK